VVVDFVVSGAYTATFDVPVIVSQRVGGSGNRPIEYVDPGTPVELGRGESVSYQLGGLAELRNPLGRRVTHFKRAVVYAGDVAATHAAGVPGVTMRANGDGVLRRPLAPGTSIGLAFVDIPEGAAFPPEEWAETVTIGPVNAETAPEGTQGYVLLVGVQKG